MTAPWARSKKVERKAAEAAVCAEASRWLHQVVADTDEDEEAEASVLVEPPAAGVA